MNRPPLGPLAAGAAILLSVLTSTAACGGSGSSSASGAGNNITYMFSQGQLTEMPMLVADEAGLFKAAGISIDRVDKPRSLPAVQGLMASGAEIGTMSTASLVQGWQGGNDVAMFCGGARYIDATLMAASSSSFPTAEDGASPEEVIRALSGKRIGVMAPVGSALQLQIAETFKQYGAKNVKYVLVGVTPSVLQGALTHGDVDAAVALPPTTQLLTRSGGGRALLFLPDAPGMSHDAYGGGYVAKVKWLTANRDLARRFCSVIKQASTHMHDTANAPQVQKVIANSMGVDAGQAEHIRKTALPTIDTSLPRPVMEKTFDLYVRTGIAKPNPAPKYEELISQP